MVSDSPIVRIHLKAGSEGSQTLISLTSVPGNNMLAVKFDEHFRQAVLANMRGAGEHIFEWDFPRDYEWSEGWRADGVRSLSRQARVTSAGEEGLCTPIITCNVINEVLQYKMFILK